MESHTCIVGVAEDDAVYMGGDAATTSYGWTRNYGGPPKVWHKDGFLFGGTGRVRTIQLARFQFSPPAVHEGQDPLEYLTTNFVKSLFSVAERGKRIRNDEGRYSLDANFLIGFRGRLYSITGCGSVCQSHKPYAAEGSGYMLALGSLHSTESLDMDPASRVVLALEAAGEYDMQVAPPYTVLRLDPDGTVETALEKS